MAISAKQVKELRDMTGAGMMDCKKALTETNGDMDEAVEYLRKSGIMKAEKKQSRIAAEGLCDVVLNGDQEAVVVEVNSETDFVAKNDTFKDFVRQVAETALNSDAEGVDELLTKEWPEDASKTVSDVLTEKTATIGEKLSIRRFEKVKEDEGCVVSYIHGGGRIGVIIDAKTDVVNEAVKDCLHNVAMQVAAMRPKYTSRDEVDQDYLEHEKEILKSQAMVENPDKPENIIEKMIIGRLNKEMKEICLLDQVYVQAEDGKQTVGAYVKQVAKETGADLSVRSFVRFETGEGLEKRQDDFAAEVAAQMGQ